VSSQVRHGGRAPARRALGKGVLVLVAANALLFAGVAGVAAAAFPSAPTAVRVVAACAAVVLLAGAALLYPRGWRLIHDLGRPNAGQARRQQREHLRQLPRGQRWAARTHTDDVAPRLFGYYVLIAAGPLLLLAMLVGVLVYSGVSTASGNHGFSGLPAWAVIAFQLLSMVGVTLIGRDLRAGSSRQLRVGAYASVGCSLVLGALLVDASAHPGRITAVGIVAVLCLAWVIGTDLAAGHARRQGGR
jgi:hypothetical protein